MPAQATQVCEISGHLIDSLTLAKVIDLIQAAQCRYAVTDIRIGMAKQDVSYARLSLFAESDAQLQKVLAELAPYGVRLLTLPNASTQACTADGTPPENAYVMPIPELALHENNQWTVVDVSAAQFVIVKRGDKAELCTITQLKAGDNVVLDDEAVRETETWH